MRISLDFNDTFNTFRGRTLAQQLIAQGNDVHIVTRLNEFNRPTVERYVKSTGIKIPSNKIHFTNGQLKFNKLRQLGVRRHYDNNMSEIEAIRRFAPGIEAIKF